MSPLSAAVAVMWRGDFSQMPVMDDRRVSALLTAETVMRFVASSLPTARAIATATVADALMHEEAHDNHLVLSPQATVFDGLAAFRRYTDEGKSLDAILIVNQQLEVESIVTIFDIPKLLAAVRSQ